MKCINVREYGNVCKKGFWAPRIKQEQYEFRVGVIKRILKGFQVWRSINAHGTENFGRVECENGDDYSVWFYCGSSEQLALSIGCKTYTLETVNKAIEAFL